MRLRNLRIKGGPDNLGRCGLIAVTHGEARVQQAVLNQVGIAGQNGVVDAVAIGDGALPCTGDTTGIVKPNDNGNRKITADVESTEDLDPDIQIRCSFFNGVEMGEVGEVAQVHLFETDDTMKRSAWPASG